MNCLYFSCQTTFHWAFLGKYTSVTRDGKVRLYLMLHVQEVMSNTQYSLYKRRELLGHTVSGKWTFP